MTNIRNLTSVECDKIAYMIKIMQFVYLDPSEIYRALYTESRNQMTQHEILARIVESVNRYDGKTTYDIFHDLMFGKIDLKKIMNNKYDDMITFKSYDGYVQLYTFVTNDDDCIIALRGSDSLTDACYDIRCRKVNILDHVDVNIGDNIWVHVGFARAISLLWRDMCKYIDRYIEHYPNNNINIIGHSLGGAIATLLSYLLTIKYNHPVIVYIAGSPAVGNKTFVDEYMQLVHDNRITLYNIINPYDTIIAQPPELFNYRALPYIILLERDNSNQLCIKCETYGRNYKYTCWTLWNSVKGLIYSNNIEHYLINYYNSIMNVIRHAMLD